MGLEDFSRFYSMMMILIFALLIYIAMGYIPSIIVEYIIPIFENVLILGVLNWVGGFVIKTGYRIIISLILSWLFYKFIFFKLLSLF